MIGKVVNFLIVHAAIIIPLILLVFLILFRPVRAAACTVLRFVARPLLLAAVVALVYDGTSTIAGGSGLVITSFADHWQVIHPASLLTVKAILSQIHPKAWDPAMLRLLRLPAWIIMGAAGLLLGFIGRKRRQLNVYVN